MSNLSLLRNLMESEPEPVRYLCVPTRRGPAGVWFVSWSEYGISAARAAAQDFFERETVPVLICENLENGTKRQIETIGKIEKKRRVAA